MKVKSPKMEPDPELERQKEAAATEKVNAIQERLGTETDAALRYFGSRQALVGSGSSRSVRAM